MYKVIWSDKELEIKQNQNNLNHTAVSVYRDGLLQIEFLLNEKLINYLAFFSNRQLFLKIRISKTNQEIRKIVSFSGIKKIHQVSSDSDDKFSESSQINRNSIFTEENIVGKYSIWMNNMYLGKEGWQNNEIWFSVTDEESRALFLEMILNYENRKHLKSKCITDKEIKELVNRSSAAGYPRSDVRNYIDFWINTNKIKISNSCSLKKMLLTSAAAAVFIIILLYSLIVVYGGI